MKLIYFPIKGVLLYGGTGILDNFKLTSSNYLIVNVINVYAASVKVNLVANVKYYIEYSKLYYVFYECLFYNLDISV